MLSLSLTALPFWVHRLYQSVSLWAVSAHTEESPTPRPPPHPFYTFRGRVSPPRYSLMVFRVHRCKFLDEDSRSFIRTWFHRSYLNTCQVPLPLAICGLEPVCPYTVKIFSCCNDIKYRYVLFLPSTQCQRVHIFVT